MAFTYKILVPSRFLRHRRIFCTKVSQERVSEISNDPESVETWQISSFGKLEKLKLCFTKKPVITKPNSVLIRVSASSVNPIDVAMLGGYGNVILDLARKLELDCPPKVVFPLTLGRDFSGEVVEKGNNVRKELKVGDKVYGVIPPHHQGCHAEYVIADGDMVTHKPEHLTNEEAAGLLYTAMTAWSALKITGDLALSEAKSKRSLVIGGSGGVGSVAIQMLKSWGAEVVTTCRKDAIPIVEKLKPDAIVDYMQPFWFKELETIGKYDLILDTSGSPNPSLYIPLLSEWKNAKFITLKSPFLKNTDTYGLFNGMIYNVNDLIKSNVTSGAIIKGSTVRWAYFLPVPYGVREISELVKDKKIMPVVDRIFSFNELPSAFERVIEGHLRGKVVVSMCTN